VSHGCEAVGRGQVWWDRWFLGMACYVSTASKDPSTQTGAVIVDPNRRVTSVGYNGFPQGIDDSPERYANRELKYKMVSHCEVNAMLFAGRALTGCTLYTFPFCSCSRCAVQVIQAGIRRCVAPVLPDRLKERWGEDTELTKAMFREAGVELVEYEGVEKDKLLAELCGRPG
jgi:dCMP deaminase